MLGTHRQDPGARARVILGFSALLLVAFALGITFLRAASPPSGDVGPGDTSTSWTGQHYAAAAIADPVAAGAACPPEIDSFSLVCDHFFVTVNVAPSYWDSSTGGVRLRIGWANASDDFDMYVYQDGQLVDSSGGATNQEEIFLQSASGTYEVRVVPFLVTDEQADGTATFESMPGGQTPNPARGSAGLGFGPAIVVDAQRTEGEPLNFVDKNGNYWESGPYGTSTSQSFIHRSTDGGDQFNVVSAVGLRPDPPPGGGDTDVVVDDRLTAYFVDLEGLVNLGCAVSNDDGNTWRKNPSCVQSTVVDRQWFALDNGSTTNAADNTVFLAFRQVPLGSFLYSSPGSTGPTDPVGGLVYTNSSADLVDAVSTGAPCGQMRFDPVKRNLYYPCAQGDHVEITVGHVNPEQRTGITYTNVQAPVSPGGGAVGDIFPAAATDKAGNLYAVWVDESDHNVYYAASTNQGQSWGPARQINGNDANSNAWVWAQGGNAGSLAVAWYGTSSHLDSDTMDSWYNDRQAATAFKWFGYAALVRKATSASPSFAQEKFTKKPMHYGQICQGGLGCTASGGDRTMADFMAVTLDRDGSMRLVYNDTTSQHHGAHVFEVRQVAGPTAFGTTIDKTKPRNPVSDPTGDAQSPHYRPVSGAGPSLPQFDFTQLKLSQPTPGTLRVEMALKSLATLAPPPGETNSLWLTRFQALSVGDQGEEAYRIFYVGAESVGGDSPSFFAGSGESAMGAVPGNGCTTTTPENCKIVQYPAEEPATGSISGNTITITVPLQGGFGSGRPIKGDRLFSVTALSAGRSAGTDIYADLDATRSFDFPLARK